MPAPVARAEADRLADLAGVRRRVRQHHRRRAGGPLLRVRDSDAGRVAGRPRVRGGVSGVLHSGGDMSTATTDRIVWGEAYRDDYSATATSTSVAPDFSTTPVTLVWDQLLPAGSTGAPLRVEYRWRPGDTSDPQFSFADGVLMFDLLAPDVVADLRPGNWRVYWCVGEPAEQDVVGPWTVFVEGPPAGALPTVDPT